MSLYDRILVHYDIDLVADNFFYIVLIDKVTKQSFRHECSGISFYDFSYHNHISSSLERFFNKMLIRIRNKKMDDLGI